MIELQDIDYTNAPKDAQKALKYFHKHGRLSHPFFDLPIIEPLFFEANGFDIGVSFECDYLERHVYFNTDYSLYYCSPCESLLRFRIRESKDIESVELIDSLHTGAGNVNGALAGGLLFGAAGAVIGAAAGREKAKKAIIIRLHTRDIQEPIVDLHIITTPLSLTDKDFAHCFDNANKIYGQFQAIAEKNNAKAAPVSTADDQADQIRIFKVLLDEGILTPEEFAAKKKQILGI